MDGAGTLYLIPSWLGIEAGMSTMPPSVIAIVGRLARFVAENPRSARAFLKAAGHPSALRDIKIGVLDEHTRAAELSALMRPLLDGEDCGLLSDAGCPAVADPGAAMVRFAHVHGVRVVPLVGPSSILLALMASGLNGQRFAFHGYLPVDAARRRAALARLEQESSRERRTQIFIEAPYRNVQLLRAILDTCRGDTLLCLATDLTTETECIHTRAVGAWKKVGAPAIDRRPSVFLLEREG